MMTGSSPSAKDNFSTKRDYCKYQLTCGDTCPYIPKHQSEGIESNTKGV